MQELRDVGVCGLCDLLGGGVHGEGAEEEGAGGGAGRGGPRLHRLPRGHRSHALPAPMEHPILLHAPHPRSPFLFFPSKDRDDLGCGTFEGWTRSSPSWRR